MPPLSSILFGLQGMLTAANGLSGILSSRLAAHNAEVLGIDSAPALHAIALGAFSTGLMYLLGAWRGDKAMMWVAVVGRAVAAVVFWGEGGAWRGVAVYEGVCGGVLAGVLGLEGWWGGMGGMGGMAEGKGKRD